MTPQDRLREIQQRVGRLRAKLPTGDNIEALYNDDEQLVLDAEYLLALSLPAGVPAAPPPQPVRDMGEATEDGDRICEWCNQQVPARHRCNEAPQAAAPPRAAEPRPPEVLLNGVAYQPKDWPEAYGLVVAALAAAQREIADLKAGRP